jgi:uncharacterized protein
VISETGLSVIMLKKIFVNLPVADLNKAKGFFSELGFTYQKEFTGEQAACMIITRDIYVMLVTIDFFKNFSKKSIADAHQTMEVQLAFNVESKDELNSLVDRAVKAGGKEPEKPQDEGFMYSRKFEDLDGHLWDFFYMDPASIPADVKGS